MTSSIMKTLQLIAMLLIIHHEVETIKSPGGIIAFDCAADTVNITSFSLVDVEPCQHELDNITTTATNIQVIQATRMFNIHVYQCKVIFERKIEHCGMHSHTSAFQESYKYILREFSPEECRALHETGSLRVHNERFIQGLTRNNSAHGSIVIVGHLHYSSCSGGQYFDGIINYDDAIVTYQYEIELYDYHAKLDISNDKIIFREGFSCPFSKGSCLDSKEGYITWNTNIDQDCTTGKYSIIYEGPANKTHNGNNNGNILFSALSNEQLFSIKTKGIIPICGYKGYESDHSQIFILETNAGERIIRNSETNARDLDLMTYFNSKITVVEQHLGNQLHVLYRRLVNDLCKVEKSLLETRLISARINPHEFASNLMKTQGYTAVIAGEVIYIIQCKAVVVVLASTGGCYQEITVKRDDQILFMSPVTHVLQQHGTQIECTPLLPAKYKFYGKWYSMDGRLHQVTPPNKLSTEVKTDWKYDYLPDLMAVGLYSEKNVEKMHSMIYESEDRRSSSVIVHRTIAGYQTDHQGFDFSHLMTENVIETTIEKYWGKFMSMTTFVGQFTSSIVGFWLIAKLFKFIIDSLVHCRILYEIYGASWKLLAAFWDSLTNLLTYRYHDKQMKSETMGIEKLTITPNQESDTPTVTLEQEPSAPCIYPPLVQSTQQPIHQSCSLSPNQADLTIRINAPEQELVMTTRNH